MSYPSLVLFSSDRLRLDLATMAACRPTNVTTALYLALFLFEDVSSTLLSSHAQALQEVFNMFNMSVFHIDWHNKRMSYAFTDYYSLLNMEMSPIS